MIFFIQKEMVRIKKQLFLKNGLIMAVSALIIRSMNLFFRVFLADRIGAEGIGLYQLTVSVYIFFAAAATSGISLTTTRLYADFSARGEYGKAKDAVRKCLIISVIAGTVLGGLLFLSANFSAEYFLRDERTAPALKLLAPSLPFMAVSACIRGYFTARRKTLPTSVEQLLEQVIEMGVFAAAFALTKPDTLAKACCTAVLGTTLAEVISFVYSLICYAVDIRKLSCKSAAADGLLKKILPVAVPVTANSCLRSGLGAVENVLIPSGLKKNGSDSADALAQYGMVSGMAMPIVTFPSVFILPFASLIVTEMSEAFARHHTKSIRHIAEKMFRLTLLYSIPVTMLILFYAGDIGENLYHNHNVGKFLVLLAPVVPFMYLDSVTDGMLKGLNEQTSYLIFNIIDSVIRVILTYLLLPTWGIWGIVAVIVISEVLNTVMSIARLVKVTDIQIMVFDWIVRPILCIVTPCLLAKPIPCHFTVKILLCLGFYTGMLFLTKKKTVCQ